MKIKSIKSAKNLSSRGGPASGWKNKTVLVRCDFDAPTSDDTRLKTCLPTINYLLKKKVKKIILIGHRGRPSGKTIKDLSLEPVAKHLEKTLNKKIDFIKKITNYQLPITNYQIAILENLRFNPAEKKNSKEFAKKLASLADIYINESFANSHRAHASVHAIQNYLPSYAGLHLEKEIKNLSSIIKKPKKPLVIIIGGAKIETKLPVIEKLAPIADHILIGGAVANNFLKVRGVDVGKSVIDEKYLAQAKKLLKKSKILNPKSKINSKFQILNSKIILPMDYKVESGKILDIGPKTIILFNGIIKSARTIIWSGPLGYFEDKKFSNGTLQIRDQILNNSKAKIVVGGGETKDVFKDIKLPKNIFVSSAGGAMLEFLAGKKLPGLRTILI